MRTVKQITGRVEKRDSADTMPGTLTLRPIGDQVTITISGKRWGGHGSITVSKQALLEAVVLR